MEEKVNLSYKKNLLRSVRFLHGAIWSFSMAGIVGSRPSVTEKMKSGVSSTGKKGMAVRALTEGGMVFREWMNSEVNI